MKFTVIIPTHNHRETLGYALSSALSQSIEDIEVFVIGDGVQDDTRQLVNNFSKEDTRIQFFDHSKGPRHGEIYRHEALKTAKGAFVAYLSDDDLWMPNHLENLANLLEDANLGNALPLVIDEKNQVNILNIDLSHFFYRNLLLSGRNRIPLSGMGHTMELYRQLPHGWRTTPPSIPTDLYMWQQFLSHPSCRPKSSMLPTICCFPSLIRQSWTNEKRGEESKLWQHNLNNTNWLANFHKELIINIMKGWNQQEIMFDEKSSSLEYRIGKYLMKQPCAKFIIKYLAKALARQPIA